MKFMSHMFHSYCCQLWWWEVSEMLQHFERHFSDIHFREMGKGIELKYCPYCGRSKDVHPIRDMKEGDFKWT